MKGTSLFTLSLLFITLYFGSANAHPCQIQENKVIYSLSGPVTMLLEELGLLNDKNLKGISLFHPVKNYHGMKMGGGLFLTRKVFKHQGVAYVFFDKSLELAKSLAKIEMIKTIEVESRGDDAFAVTKKSIGHVKGFLSGCNEKISFLENKINKIKENFKNIKLKNKKMIFYLNAFKTKDRKPNIVIVNDGFVKTLSEYDLIQTYPSKLSYVTWSAKLMKRLENDFVHIGVSSVGNKRSDDKIHLERLGGNYFNIGYRGDLIPGIRQIYFLKELVALNLRGDFKF